MTEPLAASSNGSLTYLNQAQAQLIDEELMGSELGFSLDQLMELAGLSVASAVSSEYGKCRVLVVAGPGNNGGDGLVAARHLTHFGYDVKICYPKPTNKPIYNGLVLQCESLSIPFVSWEEAKAEGGLSSSFDVVIDAVFGFSFSGHPRSPFDAILKDLAASGDAPPIVSIDIPSGWDVGDPQASNGGICPEMLVSLTAPKIAARGFKGRHHYLGGRFVPPSIRDKFQLRLPSYPGAAMCVKLNSMPDVPKVSDMRITYERGGLAEEDFLGSDPMAIWDAWFKQAVQEKVCEEPNCISLASADSNGKPSVRIVLLKGYDARGFVFYTNYNSRKGQELDMNNSAAFCVYWEKLQRQVRIEGVVEHVPENESTSYFQSRPHSSQIGAWVSNQSQPVGGKGREQLEERAKELKEVYADTSKPVPKPPHWGGYLIRPTSIEFWQGRPSRLHDRIRFSKPDTSDSQWEMVRLQP